MEGHVVSVSLILNSKLGVTRSVHGNENKCKHVPSSDARSPVRSDARNAPFLAMP